MKPLTQGGLEQGPHFYHRCNACGACCDSAPQMTVDELYLHRNRFIGCLAIQRIPRVSAGLSLQDKRVCEADDEREGDELAARIFHRHAKSRSHEIFLFTRGFSYSSSKRCPVLTAAGACGIHGDTKPNVCSVVPLDALRPDRLQTAVLQSRQKDAIFWENQCISTAPDEGFREITHRLKVVDSGSADSLRTRRSALENEKKRWGAAVFELLAPEIFLHEQALNLIPENGDFTMSLVPVLQVLLQTEPASRSWILEYLEVQIELMRTTIADAVARRQRTDRAETAQLRSLLQANQKLATHLRA